MKNFKNYMTIAAGFMLMMALLPVPIGESKSDGISRLIAVTQMKAQTANDEASQAVEKQRRLVKTSIGKAIANSANDGEEASQQPGRLTPREVVREKALLQQLEANARRAAEVLESVKRLAAELERQPRR